MATKIDLEKLNAAELHQLIKEATALLESKKDQAKQDLIAEFRTKAEQMGLALDDLMAKPTAAQSNVRRIRKDAGVNVPVKFRGPNGETWSGRGRMPTWLSVLVAEGRTKEEFAV